MMVKILWAVLWVPILHSIRVKVDLIGRVLHFRSLSTNIGNLLQSAKVITTNPNVKVILFLDGLEGLSAKAENSSGVNFWKLFLFATDALVK